MEQNKIKYQKRIVCFLDVLGFREILTDFENDAVLSSNGGRVSQKANEFVGAFKEVVSYMDGIDCNYYLFSDNICITVDPISDRSLVKEVLFLVNNLFKKFSELGYFLRGGIDYGWMLDEKDLALGNPLATAYQIESKYAIYPRIVISEAFKDLLEEEGVDFVNLIRRKCEIYYINPFYSVVQSGDKIEYFKEYKKLLEKTIKGNQKKEQVYIKYEWLVREFNWFLGQYTKFAGLIEPDIELESDEIKRIKRLKIKIS